MSGQETDGRAGHRDRLRKRLSRDPQQVADYEVLELLLGLGVKRRDTKPLAKELLARFGGMRGVLDARPEELTQVDGFGQGLAHLWRLVREVMARYASAPVLERQQLSSPIMVAAMARMRLGHLALEESWLALVDAQNRLVSWERLRQGGVSSVPVQPREVLTQALLHHASGIILVHNHPGGNPTPSQADLALTADIAQHAPALGLRLLDHIIVTSGDCYSIAAKKRIPSAEVK